MISRPKHYTSLLDASKQPQLLVGALEATQTQQQELHQMVREQVQAHLAEGLSNWRAEQQMPEETYLERIYHRRTSHSSSFTQLVQVQKKLLFLAQVWEKFWRQKRLNRL